MFHNSDVFCSCIIHILYIYSTNTGTEYFKHGIYSPFFPLQNAVCFIILTYLVPVLFTFYIQSVLKLKYNSGTKSLNKALKLSFAQLHEEFTLAYLTSGRSEISIDCFYQCADKSLTRPRRKRARKHVKGRARFQQHRYASCHHVVLFPPARQGAEGNSRHCDRSISLFPSWSG